MNDKPHDPVNHPKHYTSHPSGVEAIEIARHASFNIGNVIKYCWRSGLKDGNPSVQDLRKAKWYLEDEIRRIEGKPDHVLDMAPGEGIATIFRGFYQNDVKSDIDETARAINEAVNPDYQTPPTGFQKELEGLINDYSMESGSDTPDFLLAELLCDVLEVWNKAVVAREAWYGRVTEPVSPENWPTQNDTVPGESLDALEAEMKKSAAPIVMIDGKPHFVFDFQNGDPVFGEEVPDEWDGYRHWDYGKVIRWRGALYRQSFAKAPRSATYPPDQSERWTRLPE